LGSDQEIACRCSSLYVNERPPPAHNVELALYADDTAIIDTSLKPTLLVSYLES